MRTLYYDNRTTLELADASNTRLYIATYNASGKLTELKTWSLVDGIYTFTMPEDTVIYKIILWDVKWNQYLSR